MNFKEILDRIFHTKDGEIQRAYEAYDRASGLLGQRDKNPEFSNTVGLDEAVKEAEDLAVELLANYEEVKSWPGIFREMHMNLTRLRLQTERYDDALKACDDVAKYNAMDAEELRETIEEAMSGKKLEATQLDEVGVA
jgi:tetratricopeptide (TPR) repeat protein